MKKHTIPIRIYYEDTDAGGIVYHANYLKFAERGRTEFLRHIGFECSDIQNKLGIMFVVRHIDINYTKPAYLDDLLSLETTITTIKNTSFIMRQRSINGVDVYADMKVVCVCVDANTYKPTRLPIDIKQAFQEYIEVLE